MKMTILHMSAPKIQVLVTSQMTEGGAQKTMTRMSARARFTMKMLVIDCIDLVDATAENTWKADENTRCCRIYVLLGLYLEAALSWADLANWFDKLRTG